jgi:hypothetical protein
MISLRDSEVNSSTQPIANTNQAIVTIFACRRGCERQAGSVEIKPPRNQHHGGINVSAARKSGRQTQLIIAPESTAIIHATEMLRRIELRPAEGVARLDADVSIPRVYANKSGRSHARQSMGITIGNRRDAHCLATVATSGIKL